MYPITQLTSFISRSIGFVTGRSFAAIVVSRDGKVVVSVRCKFRYSMRLLAASWDFDKHCITRNFSSTSFTQATFTPVINLQMKTHYCKQFFLTPFLGSDSTDAFVRLDQYPRNKMSPKKLYQNLLPSLN